MKRAYREVRVAPAGAGWRIMLDARELQTPARLPLLLPKQELAVAIAGEWQAQTDKIVPSTMPLMRLAATAVDRVAPQQEKTFDDIVGYAETDLVCYRAERPADLVARQTAAWQPLVDWAILRFDAPLLVVTGVVPKRQSPAVAAALRAAIADMDEFWLSALHEATTLSGSIVIGLALRERRLDAEAAWRASQLDESYQIEKWGEDAEAARRRADIRRDLDAACRFMGLLRT